MASSSDWVAALAGESPAQSSALPGWAEALGASGAFAEGLPSLRPAPLTPAPPANVAEPSPAPASEPAPPDPVAEAFAKGEAAGRAAAASELALSQTRERSLRLGFRELDQAAIDTLAGDLAETVIALCSEAIGAFQPDAASLTEMCRAAAGRIGKASAGCSLHLHPADLAMIDKDCAAAWKIVPDETIERGGLRFEGPDGCVSDGPAEWRRAIATAVRG